MKHTAGFYINCRRGLLPNTCVRELEKGENLLKVFDILINSNDNLSCRWSNEDNFFTLEEIDFGKTKFFFNKPLGRVTTLEEMDKFFNLLNQKVASIKLISILGLKGKARKEVTKTLEKAIKEVFKQLNVNYEKRKSKKVQVRYHFYLWIKDRDEIPGYIYKDLPEDNLLKMFDIVDNVNKRWRCRWENVNGIFKLTVIQSWEKGYFTKAPYPIYATSLEEMDKVLEFLTSEVFLPEDIDSNGQLKKIVKEKMKEMGRA